MTQYCLGDSYYKGFHDLVAYLKDNKVLLISTRDITLKPHVYGEDYYIYTLVLKLREKGIIIDIAIYSQNNSQLYQWSNGRRVQNIDNFIRNYDVAILHIISPFRLIKFKLKHKLNFVMSVIFLWNKTSPFILNIRWLMGEILWQIVTDRYIATSPSIARRLERLVFRKIYVVPPVYECKFCLYKQNYEKLLKLREQLPQEVKVVYIGSTNPKRLPIAKVINMFHSDTNRKYRIDIYTVSPIEYEVFETNNVLINYYHRKLTDAEKCKVLQESHLFIAPTLGTTMDPSISVIEAEYHGNIVIRS